MGEIKIIIVDDSATFREGLRFYIETILHLTVIDEVCNGEEFIRLNNKSKADIILMDIEMPVLNGIDAARLFLQDHINRIIAITSFEDKVYLTQLIEAGFKGCICKKNIHDELKDAILRVLEGKLYFPRDTQ